MSVRKVTLRKPSEDVVAEASLETTARDRRGRVFTLRKPNVLAQYRLVRTLGGEASKNEVYMNMIMPILWVAAIDGEEIPPFRTEMELEALILRIEEDGLVAIASALGGMSVPPPAEPAESVPEPIVARLRG